MDSTVGTEPGNRHKELDDVTPLAWMPHIFSSSTSGFSVHILEGLDSIVDQDS